jgi:hypothetical protein
MRLSPSLIVLALLAGCPPSNEGRDRDGDGFETAALGGDDCNDADATINPGANELCADSIDNNCDGAVDDTGTGARLFYADTDGDGWGDPEVTQESCEAPSTAWTEQVGDCDDSARAIRPGAVEIYYNGIDENCDPLDDNDQDADGEDATAQGGTDCDDTNGEVNTSAVEVCENGLDDNCDGAAPACLWSSSNWTDLRNGSVDTLDAIDHLVVGDFVSEADDVMAWSVANGEVFTQDRIDQQTLWAVGEYGLSLPGLPVEDVGLGYIPVFSTPNPSIIVWWPDHILPGFRAARWSLTNNIAYDLQFLDDRRAVGQQLTDAGQFSIPVDNSFDSTEFTWISYCYVGGNFNICALDNAPLLDFPISASSNYRTKSALSVIPGLLRNPMIDTILVRRDDDALIKFPLDLPTAIGGNEYDLDDFTPVDLGLTSDQSIFEAMGDHDGDASDELLIVDANAPNPSLRLLFGPIEDASPSTRTLTIAANADANFHTFLDAISTDINGDGTDDLALLYAPSIATLPKRLAVFYGPLDVGTLNPTTADSVVLLTDFTPALETGDIDNDGRQDIVFLTSAIGFGVLYGTGQ